VFMLAHGIGSTFRLTLTRLTLKFLEQHWIA
jgi:hypothetical protein